MLPTTANPATAQPPPAAPRPSLEALFVDEEPRLLRLALGITGDFAAAQDVVQDAFLRLHPRYAGIEQPRSWLFVAVRRLALDHLRRRKPAAGVDSLAETPAEDSGQRRDERAESVALLRLSLGELPARDREIVRLRFEEELDYAEIANRTGLTVGNVGYRLHHTLRRLGDALRKTGLR